MGQNDFLEKLTILKVMHHMSSEIFKIVQRTNKQNFWKGAKKGAHRMPEIVFFFSKFMKFKILLLHYSACKGTKGEYFTKTKETFPKG